MTQHRPLNYGDPIPDSFLDALQELISTYVSPNFTLVISAPTQITLAAGTDVDQVGVAINGRWRWIVAPLTVTHPGGAAGNYDVWATASDNAFQPSVPEEIDLTDYSFAIQIRPVGSAPATALSRKVGQLHWTGTAIDAATVLTRNAPLARGTTLPTSPNDGDEFVLVVDGVARTYWHFKLDSGKGAHRWTFLGGAPILRGAGSVGSAAGSSGGTATDLTSLITIPVAGWYLLHALMPVLWSGATPSPNLAALQVAVNGGAYMLTQAVPAHDTSQGWTVATLDLYALLAAGDTVKAQLVDYATNVHSYNTVNALMTVLPVQVG